MRGIIVALALSFTLYVSVIAAVVIAKGHASRGTLGISVGAR